jgi:hypothetical protein
MNALLCATRGRFPSESIVLQYPFLTQSKQSSDMLQMLQLGLLWLPPRTDLASGA